MHPLRRKLMSMGYRLGRYLTTRCYIPEPLGQQFGVNNMASFQNLQTGQQTGLGNLANLQQIKPKR